MYNSETEHKRTEAPGFPPRGPLSRRDFLKSLRVVHRMHKYVEDLLEELLRANGDLMTDEEYEAWQRKRWGQQSDSED